jgi:hypothetical protein
MNIALIFNCDAPEYCYGGGLAIEKKVLQTGIMQRSERHMKISAGNVLIRSQSKTWVDYDDLCERVFFFSSWARLHEARLRATFRKARLYAVVVENMTSGIAEDLHKALTSDESYLGLQSVDYSYGPHLALYRNSILPLYRIQGGSCWVFFTMAEDSKNKDDFDAMRKVGFDSVQWEDLGAHGSVFDDYDTLEHFQQVANFRAAVTPYLVDGEDNAYELVMMLEDLNPTLFNALGAAVDALGRARNEEHVAQAALSGRRYMEQLADVLFPAQQVEYKGRRVGKTQYKNRIWAFIADNAAADHKRLDALGRETDRLVEEFNACLHEEQPRDRLLRAFAGGAKLTAALLALNPEKTREPYFAYRKRAIEFMRDVVKTSEEQE